MNFATITVATRYRPRLPGDQGGFVKLHAGRNIAIATFKFDIVLLNPIDNRVNRFIYTCTVKLSRSTLKTHIANISSILRIFRRFVVTISDGAYRVV